jgi:hypothetical protein
MEAGACGWALNDGTAKPLVPHAEEKERRPVGATPTIFF